jgi:hypothetical protein
LDAAFSLSTACAVLVSYYLHIHDLTLMQLPLGLMAGHKNSYISRSALVFYLAPQLLMLFAPKFLYLLALPVMMLLYGIAQASPVGAAQTADQRGISVASTP